MAYIDIDIDDQLEHASTKALKQELKVRDEEVDPFGDGYGATVDRLVEALNEVGAPDWIVAGLYDWRMSRNISFTPSALAAAFERHKRAKAA